MGSSALYLIALSMVPSVGAVTARKLISYLGSAEAVFREKPKVLMKIPGIGEIISRKTMTGSFIEMAGDEIDFCMKRGIEILDLYSDAFPSRLRQCSDSPLILYKKGKAGMNPARAISIVGTRRASNEGISNTHRIVRDIGQEYPETVIVSGLAYGIDYQAHLASLKNNLPTMAVLGHGLHTIYPAQHKNLAEKIMENGCLITEFASQVNPERNNFIRRNRLIAGLSDATIVAESGIKGGALITADIAASYHRDVFAFPGRVSDEYSRGCNRLIKENKAGLIEGLEDLEYFMNWNRKGAGKQPKQGLLFMELTKEEEKIVDLIRERKQIDRDSMSNILNIQVHKLSAILLHLEFEGVISVLPGNQYKLS